MKIGILQCGHAAPEVLAEHGDYTDMFQRLLAGHGFDFATWDVVDMDFPPGPAATLTISKGSGKWPSTPGTRIR